MTMRVREARPEDAEELHTLLHAAYQDRGDDRPLTDSVERVRADIEMLDTIPTHPWLPEFYRKHGFEERCLEKFPDGNEWLQFRRKLR